MAIIKLGHSKNPANQIKFPDPTISRDHLEIEWIDGRALRIKDLNSENGTKVNGFPIVSKTVKPEDTIKIGEYKMSGQDLIDLCRPFAEGNRVNYTNEFREIELRYYEWKEKEKKIVSSFNLKVTIVRIISILGLMYAAYKLMNYFNVEATVNMAISITTSSLGGYIAGYLVSSSKLEISKQKLRDDFDLRYRCPKCNLSLMQHNIEYWKKQRICNNQLCRAIWVN